MTQSKNQSNKWWLSECLDKLLEQDIPNRRKLGDAIKKEVEAAYGNGRMESFKREQSLKKRLQLMGEKVKEYRDFAHGCVSKEEHERLKDENKHIHAEAKQLLTKLGGNNGNDKAA